MIDLAGSEHHHPGFFGEAAAVITGLTKRHAPSATVVVTIRDWFGPKWIPYIAGSRGKAGEYSRRVPAPPFVPNRVVRQDLFTSPTYIRNGSGPTLHRVQSSGEVISVTPFELAPDTIFVWLSDGSSTSGRGAMLGLVPAEDTCWAWYAGYAGGTVWHPTDLVGISREELASLRREGEGGVADVGAK